MNSDDKSIPAHVADPFLRSRVKAASDAFGGGALHSQVEEKRQQAMKAAAVVDVDVDVDVDWTESARHVITSSLDRSRCRDCGVSARDAWLNKQALCSACWKDAMSQMQDDEFVADFCVCCGDDSHELYGSPPMCADCWDAPPTPSERWDAAQEAKRGEL